MEDYSNISKEVLETVEALNLEKIFIDIAYDYNKKEFYIANIFNTSIQGRDASSSKFETFVFEDCKNFDFDTFDIDNLAEQIEAKFSHIVEG